MILLHSKVPTNAKFCRFQSANHVLKTVLVYKLCLSPFNCKHLYPSIWTSIDWILTLYMLFVSSCFIYFVFFVDIVISIGISRHLTLFGTPHCLTCWLAWSYQTKYTTGWLTSLKVIHTKFQQHTSPTADVTASIFKGPLLVEQHTSLTPQT